VIGESSGAGETIWNLEAETTRRSALTEDAAIFESHRSTLVSHAYRMLGDFGRAEDVVQDAWLRWQRRDVKVDMPEAFLITVVTRLCLNELESARARREESRSDRLPEPIDLRRGGLDPVEAMDEVSMAFLVVLQRLTPAERAVLLLHDVLDFTHADIAALMNKSEQACRQLLRRARGNIAAERRSGIAASREEHWRILRAFLGAIRAGDVDALRKLLADDAVLVADGGADGVTVGRVRNIPRPVTGAAKVAAFLAATSSRDGGVETSEHELNGQPALIARQNGRIVAAMLLAVADGRVHRVFIHADPAHLGHLAAS
jgi:RNA polymerase sigma-70 factor (ECF subfamily)